jgi:hypothetical protein
MGNFIVKNIIRCILPTRRLALYIIEYMIENY